jgi:hypothetical protein
MAVFLNISGTVDPLPRSTFPSGTADLLPNNILKLREGREGCEPPAGQTIEATKVRAPEFNKVAALRYE